MSSKQHAKKVPVNSMRTGAILLAFACAAATAALAVQQQPEQGGDPALHRRSTAQPDGAPTPVQATGHTNLPPAAEGQYPWDKLGGEIEVYFENGQLHGYMTEHMDPNQHASPVTFDFATTHVDAHAVEWRTRVVHGTSYSFTGHLERGLVPSPSLPGYYVLAGTLTQHGGDADGFVRTVSLKREPGTP
jgi:hypothetical protein